MNILRLAFLRKKAKLTEKMTDFYRKNTIGIGFLMRIQWVSYRQQRGFAEELRMCINCNCSAFHCSSSVQRRPLCVWGTWVTSESAVAIIVFKGKEALVNTAGGHCAFSMGMAWGVNWIVVGGLRSTNSFCFIAPCSGTLWTSPANLSMASTLSPEKFNVVLNIRLVL